MFASVAFGVVYQYSAKQLTGKNVSEMIYILHYVSKKPDPATLWHSFIITSFKEGMHIIQVNLLKISMSIFLVVK